MVTAVPDNGLLKLEQRYYNDPMFAKMVDAFIAVLRANVCQSQDITDAVTFAAFIASHLKPDAS